MESQNKKSKGIIWTSYILQGLLVAMFLMGALSNILQTELAVNGALEMGYSKESVPYLGVVLLVISILFAIPKTNIIAGLLITAWLGGGVATHVIHGDPLANILAPVIFGIVVWFSLLLRNDQLRALLFSVKAKK